MKSLIPFKTAGHIAIALLGLLLIFHALVITGVVSPDIVWGGRLDGTPDNLLVMEIVALHITALFILIVVARLDYVFKGKFRLAKAIGIWVIFGYMVLNTLGNLAASSPTEKLIFTPLTVILALLMLRLGIGEKS